jgi:hypothetical protein
MTPRVMALVVDAILLLIVAETAVLVAWRRRTALLPNLLAGFALLLALRLALSGAAAMWLGLCLLAAGAAHGADLATRQR